MVTRFLKWFIFTLVVSVFPLLAVAGLIRVRGGQTSLNELLGTGELLTICCALSAAAIGDVLASKRHPNERLICAAVCGTVVLAAILWYSVVGMQIHFKEPYDEELLVRGSVLLYFFTAATSAYCVGFAEKK